MLQTKSFLSLYYNLNDNVQNEILEEILSKKNLYVLFKVSEAYNSSDLDSEIEYMVRGYFLSYEKAFKEFLNEVLENIEIELDEDLEEEDRESYEEEKEKFEGYEKNIDNMTREEMDDILLEEEWKILEV